MVPAQTNPSASSTLQLSGWEGLVRQSWSDQRWAVEMWRLLALVLVPTRMTCPTHKPQAVARTILWAQRQIKPALRGAAPDTLILMFKAQLQVQVSVPPHWTLKAPALLLPQSWTLPATLPTPEQPQPTRSLLADKTVLTHPAQLGPF